MKQYKLKVYYWNPNGTNDISVEGSWSQDGYASATREDAMSEALFGLDVTKLKTYNPEYGFAYVSLKTALKHVAISPVSDGSSTIEFLSQYFKSIRGVK